MKFKWSFWDDCIENGIFMKFILFQWNIGIITIIIAFQIERCSIYQMLDLGMEANYHSDSCIINIAINIWWPFCLSSRLSENWIHLFRTRFTHIIRRFANWIPGEIVCEFHLIWNAYKFPNGMGILINELQQFPK